MTGLVEWAVVQVNDAQVLTLGLGVGNIAIGKVGVQRAVRLVRLCVGVDGGLLEVFEIEVDEIRRTRRKPGFC